MPQATTPAATAARPGAGDTPRRRSSRRDEQDRGRAATTIQSSRLSIAASSSESSRLPLGEDREPRRVAVRIVVELVGRLRDEPGHERRGACEHERVDDGPVRARARSATKKSGAR